jgi:hypothetical protein
MLKWHAALANNLIDLVLHAAHFTISIGRNLFVPGIKGMERAKMLQRKFCDTGEFMGQLYKMVSCKQGRDNGYPELIGRSMCPEYIHTLLYVLKVYGNSRAARIGLRFKGRLHVHRDVIKQTILQQSF